MSKLIEKEDLSHRSMICGAKFVLDIRVEKSIVIGVHLPNGCNGPQSFHVEMQLGVAFVLTHTAAFGDCRSVNVIQVRFPAVLAQV